MKYFPIILVITGILCAQEQELIYLQRIDGIIELDGFSNELAWEGIEMLPLSQHQPAFGDDPTERSEIRVAFDDEFFYASGRFYDSDPDGIRGNTLTRDGMSAADDVFSILLDTFNDNENALCFNTTPAGMRIDFTIAGDGEAQRGFPGNTTWNTFWDAATVRNDEGWFVEVRIPFSSLRFQEKDGQVVMGLIVARFIARKNEKSTYPSIEPKWTWSTYKPSMAQDVILTDVKSKNPLYVTPYVLGGASKYAELNASETAYNNISKITRNLGLDLKYGLTSNLTMDLTLSTDFAQVEADDQRVNLTRFSLFFPEKRIFFQERSSIFNFSTGGTTSLFYSRRIGLSDEGKIPIIGGARIVGRIGNWDLGFLNMQTAEATFYEGTDDEITVPTENFGVLRLRRQIFNENSYTGAIFTNRLAADGSKNTAYGIDGLIRIFGDDYITYMWAQTFDDTIMSTGLSSGRIRGVWERRTSIGLSYNLDAIWSGADFKPGMGYTRRTDVTRIRTEIEYGWLSNPDSPIYSHQPGLEGSVYWRNADGSLDSWIGAAKYTFRLKRGGFLYVKYEHSFENLLDSDSFTLSTTKGDIDIPGGNYHMPKISFFGSSSRSKLISARINANYSGYYGGTRITTSISPTWIISKYIELRGSLQINHITFRDLDQTYDANVASLRIKANVSTKLSTNAYIQFNSASQSVGVNYRIRYNPREGTDLYLVYDEGLNLDREGELPTLPFSTNRSLIMKYSTTLVR